MGRAVKNSLEITINQVRLEGGFKRGGRIRVAECLRQIVPDRWASIRKSSFTKWCLFEPFCVWIMLERSKSAETWKLMLSWPVSSVCSAQASASGKLGCWGERGGDGRMVGVPHLPPQCQVPISVRSGQHQIYPPARHPKIYRWVRVRLNQLSLFYMYSLPLSVEHSSSLS